MRTAGSRALVLFLAMAAIGASGCSISFSHDPEKTVVVDISDIERESDRDAVMEKLGTMVDGNSRVMTTTYAFGSLEVKLSPVSDVDKFVKGIDFGEVTSVEGRTIKVKFKQAPGVEF